MVYEKRNNFKMLRVNLLALGAQFLHGINPSPVCAAVKSLMELKMVDRGFARRWVKILKSSLKSKAPVSAV